MVYDECSISHKYKTPACLCLNMKTRTYFEPFTYHVYLFIYSLFKVDFYLAYKLRNTVERTYQTLLQNLWLKSLFSNPEDYVTMRNFLLRTFNSDVSPFWQWQPNSFEEKILVKQSQPYEITLTQKSNFGRYADYSGYIPHLTS